MISMEGLVLLAMVSLAIISCGGSPDDSAKAQAPVFTDKCEITNPPKDIAARAAALGDISFDKYCSANGIPRVAPASVHNFALNNAWYALIKLLEASPEAAGAMIKAGMLVRIYGNDERLAEISHVKNYKPYNREVKTSHGKNKSSLLVEWIVYASEAELTCGLKDRLLYGENRFISIVAQFIYAFGTNVNYKAKVEAAYKKSLARTDPKYSHARRIKEDATIYFGEGVKHFYNVRCRRRIRCNIL